MTSATAVVTRVFLIFFELAVATAIAAHSHDTYGLRSMRNGQRQRRYCANQGNVSAITWRNASPVYTS